MYGLACSSSLHDRRGSLRPASIISLVCYCHFCQSVGSDLKRGPEKEA
jgi:hypothetical protein